MSVVLLCFKRQFKSEAQAQLEKMFRATRISTTEQKFLKVMYELSGNKGMPE